MHKNVRLGVIVPTLALAILACTCDMAGIQEFLSPSVGPPEGWVPHDNAYMGITVYHPPTWETMDYGTESFDIAEIDGDGWIVIYMLNSETAQNLGLTYNAGMDGEEILAAIMADAPDVTFGEIETFRTQAGEATAVRAYDTEYDEGIYVAVVPLDDRAVLGLGWGYGRDTWEEEYVPVYEDIVRNIHETEE
jgi:hypothetical protein